MMSEERRNKIKNSLKITKEKRKTQDVIVIKLKIDKNKLNNKSIKTLNTMFLEAKWLYNYILDKEFNNDIFKFDYKTNYVDVYVKDHYEKRKINYLSAQMKQDLLKRTKNNISGLHELKENGFKIGKLKFKKEINSIPLREYDNTYNIINNCNYIKIQRIKQPLKVNGFYETFTDDENIKHKLLKYDLNALDFGNAMLINKNNNYYINITAYAKKEEKNNNKIIGIDPGIKTQLTMSNGLKLEYNIPKSKREIILQRELSRKAKYAEGSNKKLSREQSKNYSKNKNRLNREQQKRNNKKRDVKNKIVHYLTSSYKIIITQNDNISGWQKLFGKKIENTGIGSIIEALKSKASNLILIGRFIPTTKECNNCHNKYDIKLNERIYKCPSCGLVIDRDYNSSLNMTYYGMKTEKFKKIVPEDSREFTPVEIIASGFEGLNISPYVKLSMVNEAGSLYALA